MDRSSQSHSQNADSPFSLVRSHLSIIPHYRQPITLHKRRFSILIGPFLIDSCQLTHFQVICIIFGPIRGRYLCFPIPHYYCGTIRNLIVVYASSIKVYLVGPRGLMDKASDFGSEDSRLESWRGRRSFLFWSALGFAFFVGSDQRLTLETSLSPFSLLWYNLLYQFL